MYKQSDTLMDKEYLIYEGQAFTVEWYYNRQEKIKLLSLVKRIGDTGEIKDKTKFRHEGNRIYAFKPKPDRFLCFFFDGKKIVITNAFRKKQGKLPENERKRAENYKSDYVMRVKKGNYYD